MPLVMMLEPRLMFDGAAVVDAAHAAAEAAIKAVPAPVIVREADPSKDNGKKEVVFVDTKVTDYKSLEAGIRDGVAIVEIDGSTDGLAQMAQWAETHSGYDAIHVLSHGSEGNLRLGSNTLTTTGLSDAAIQVELSVVGQALAPGGDLLIYGCGVASGLEGEAFISALATATGADVAASDDITGAVAQGGDWVLERSTGDIAAVSLGVDGMRDFTGSLLSATITFEAGNGTITNAASQTVTYTHANITLTVTANDAANSNADQIDLGSVSGAGAGHNGSESLYFVNSGKSGSFTFTAGGGKVFDLTSFILSNQNGNGSETFSITTNKGGSFTFSSGNGGISKDAITVNSDVSNYQGISWFTVTAPNGGAFMEIDDIVLDNIMVTPSFTSGATANFAENGSGTVYTAAATASSGGGTVSYSLSGGADQAKFSINSSSGILTFTSSPNFESPTDADTNNTYVVTVRATDSNGSADKTVTVTVTNVNEAPSFTSGTTVNFAENGTGTVYTATSSDPDAGATATYSIVGGADQGKFSINSSSGVLTFQSAPNYEVATDSDTNNTYVVTLRVSDGALTADQTVTVTVTNVNEAPTAVNDTGTATEAGGLSNATAGSNATGNVLTNDTDPDAGATKTVSAVRTGNMEGAGTAGTVGQALAGAYGSLTLNSDGSFTYVVLDSDSTVQALASGQTLTDSYNYTVSDGALTDTAVLVITITGANDLPVLGGTFTTAGTVNDNATTTPFSSVTFTDVDGGAVSVAITYTAANGTFASGGGGLTGSAGSYTLSGASPAALQTLLQALVFTPTANQTSPGGTVVTTFTLTPSDATGSGTANATTQVTATSINDVPAMDLDVSNGGSTGYTSTFSAGGSAVALANTDATLSDVDAGAAISSLTATLGARPDGDANESLSLSTAAQTAATNAGLTVGYTAGTGVLSITGSAAPSVYQTVLRGITYNNTSVSNVTDRSVSIVANDGTGNSNTATATVQVKFAPVIDLNSGTGGNTHSASFTEDGGAVALSSTSAITDADDTNLTQMVVTLTNPLDGASEVLSSTYGTGAQTVNGETLTFTLSNSNHTMTITGTGTKASYQMAIDSLRYNNTSQAPSTTARTVTFVGTDAHSDAGASSTATVSVTAVNDAPALSGNLSLSAVNEDTNSPAGATIASLASGIYSDPDNGAETINGLAIIGNTANSSTQGAWQYSTDGTNWFAVGTVADGATALALSAATKLRFVPVADYNGTPTALSVRALDASYAAGWTSGSTKVTVDTTTTGGTSAIAGTARSVTTSITSVNDSPSATLTSSSVAFNRTDGYVAVDSTITLADVDSTNLTRAVVTITNPQDGASETLSSTFGTGAQTVNGETLTFTLSNSNHTMTITGSGTKATYQLALRSIRFNDSAGTPNNTSRTVSIQVRDDSADAGTQDSTTVNRSVTFNTAPVAGGAALTLSEGKVGSAYSFTLPAGTFTDADNDALSYTVSGLPAGLTMSTAGVISGNPTSPVDSVTLTFTATDPSNATATKTATLKIKAADTVAPPPGDTGADPVPNQNANQAAQNQTGQNDQSSAGLVTNVRSAETAQNTVTSVTGALSSVGNTPITNLVSANNSQSDSGSGTNQARNAASFGTSQSATISMAGGTPIGNVVAASMNFASQKTAFTTVATSSGSSGEGRAVGASTPTATTPSASSGFSVAVANRPAGGGDALVVNSRMPDASFAGGARIAVTIPAQTFAHTKAEAAVTLSAQQQNGAALPGWLAFNPRTGTFEGTPPPGFRGEVVVKVVAKDNEGREAVQTFKIQVGTGQGNVAPEGGGQGQGQGAPGRSGDLGLPGKLAKAVGRPGLTEQLRNLSRDGQKSDAKALIALLTGKGRAA